MQDHTDLSDGSDDSEQRLHVDGSIARDASGDLTRSNYGGDLTRPELVDAQRSGEKTPRKKQPATGNKKSKKCSNEQKVAKSHVSGQRQQDVNCDAPPAPIAGFSSPEEMLLDLSKKMTSMDKEVKKIKKNQKRAHSPASDGDTNISDVESEHHKRSRHDDSDDANHYADHSDDDDGDDNIASLLITTGKADDNNADADILDDAMNEWSIVEKEGPKISAKLAVLANNLHVKACEKEKLQLKICKYARPSNCEQLIVPLINPEVLEHLP